MHTDRWLSAQESQAKSQEIIAAAEKRKADAMEDMARSFKRIARYLESYWSGEWGKVAHFILFITINSLKICLAAVSLTLSDVVWM